MLPEYFALIGALFASLGGFYYLYETITGKSQPNRVTWFLWGLFPMITFVAQRAEGVGELSWVTFTSGLTPILVFIASFINKKAYWKTRRMDFYLLGAALVGIALWAITDNANLAILFTIIADLCACIPTLVKCYKHPESESWIAYALSTFGFALAILAIPSYTFANYAFVIYLFLANGALAVLASRKPTKGILHTEP